MSQNVLSRRRFLTASSLMAAGVTAHPLRMFAQAATPPFLQQYRDRAKTAKITTTKLNGNVSVLMGSGGNIGVLTGPEGDVIIDSGVVTSQPQISEALAGLSSGKPAHLINTHWHFDHTDGNEWMHAAGAKILAHENTKKRLSTPQYMEVIGVHFAPAPVAARPTETFTDTKLWDVNGENIYMEHVPNAHTDTDIFVQFLNADVLHMGDIWFNGAYPLIDLSTGGGINGMVAGANRGVQRAGKKTIIIPGHGAVGDLVALKEYRDMLTEIRDNVAALKKQGKTIDEAVAAKPSAKWDEKYSKPNSMIGPDAFVKFVYKSV